MRGLGRINHVSHRFNGLSRLGGSRARLPYVSEIRVRIVEPKAKEPKGRKRTQDGDGTDG